MIDDEPFLTYCASTQLFADPTCYVLTPEYEEAFVIKAKNGWSIDGTEFYLTQQKTAVLTTSKLIPYDLTPVNGPQQGRMRDGGIQEIDLETGDLVFHWSWADHWNITDCIQLPKEGEGSPEKPWDPFHINSVQKDTAGNYLVSSRHTNSVGYFSSQSGEWIWRLGGKQNDFEDLSNGEIAGISMQHHARFLEENATISLFDNGVNDDPNYKTRGKIIDLDLHAMTAKIRYDYVSPHAGSKSRGSMQVLDNGNAFLGYGVNLAWSEFSQDGELLCDVHLGPESGFGTENVLSYRVFKRNWVGRPRTSPDITHVEGNIYVSWNGATEVATWTLFQGDSVPSDYTPLASVSKEGFETRLTIPANTSTSSFRVAALDRDGHYLGLTPVVHVDDSIEQKGPFLVTQYQRPLVDLAYLLQSVG
ncbi:hypothetical protein DTO021C3_2812 [Paecilomyces variotii]|nr:hypothetical protein DTO021C3_2812 [Paecilomyces variotii]